MTSPIAYSPKTWADLPAGGTPITAAELNRMERGVRDAARLMDRPGGFTSLDPPTRRAAFMWGGGNETTFTDKNTGFIRLPFQIPVATTRWRVRIRNANASGTTTGAGAVTYGPFDIMSAFRNFDTGDMVSWSGTPARALAASSSQAAGAADWVSAWVTASNLQIPANLTYYLQMQYSKTSGSTVYAGSGGCYYSATLADATSTTPAMTYFPYVPFNIAIEYEFVGGNKILVAVGDSITEGAKHVWNINSWHQIISQRYQMPVALSGAFGSFASDFGSAATLAQPRWQRIRDAGLDIDAGIMMLGTNETAFGGTLLQAQQGIHGTATRMRSEWGARDVYAMTIFPQNATSTRETLRGQVNAWLRSGSPLLQGVFDTQPWLESAIDGPNMRASYAGSGSDFTHPGPAGQLAMANSVNLVAY